MNINFCINLVQVSGKAILGILIPGLFYTNKTGAKYITTHDGNKGLDKIKIDKAKTRYSFH